MYNSNAGELWLEVYNSDDEQENQDPLPKKKNKKIKMCLKDHILWSDYWL